MGKGCDDGKKNGLPTSLMLQSIKLATIYKILILTYSIRNMTMQKPFCNGMAALLMNVLYRRPM